MKDNYEQFLDRAYSKLPKLTSASGRFEVPEPITNVAGKRTFISNFKEICDIIRRDASLVLRHIAKELATAASIEGSQAVFQGKFGSHVIKRLIEDFVQENVICPVCHSPDTKLIKEERFRFIICEACGAKSPVRIA